ncbi:MAG: hypothetical protein HYX43_02695 [Burkholderiales bacterium]|nr:hypothetical protein [Burkholderiales bacterium]
MQTPSPLVRRASRWALGAALIVGLASTALAIPEPQFQNAFQQFLQASAGNTAAIEHAAEAFSGLVKSEPTNPVLLAYAGAATAMKATTTWLPWKKLGFAEDGLAQLDKALTLLTPAHEAPVQNGTPGVLEVKFVAANTFLAVPAFMHRQERGAKLLGEVVASPLLASAPLGFKGTVWLKAAKEASKAQNPTEAKRYLDLIVQQQAPQAAQAQALLKGLSS